MDSWTPMVIREAARIEGMMVGNLQATEAAAAFAAVKAMESDPKIIGFTFRQKPN